MAACRLDAFLSRASAACLVWLCAALTAAFWEALSKVVVIRRPPPLIWLGWNPAWVSSFSTILSRNPLGPPYRSLIFTSGNLGSFAAYLVACAGVIAPVSAIEFSTYS